MKKETVVEIKHFGSVVEFEDVILPNQQKLSRQIAHRTYMDIVNDFTQSISRMIESEFKNLTIEDNNLGKKYKISITCSVDEV